MKLPRSFETGVELISNVYRKGVAMVTSTNYPRSDIHRQLTAFQVHLFQASRNAANNLALIGEAIDQSATSKKVTEIGTDVTGLRTSVEEISKVVKEVADLVSEEKFINNVSAVLEKNGALKDALLIIPGIYQILQKIADTVTSEGDPNSETLSINPEYWDVLRKGLQLLNTLEDWVLADDFQEADTAKLKRKHATSGTNTEFVELTYESLLHKFIALIKECQSLHISIEKVEELFKSLHDSFPKKDDSANRADYYCKIIQARTELVRLFSEDNISTLVSNPPNSGTTGAIS